MEQGSSPTMITLVSNEGKRVTISEETLKMTSTNILPQLKEGTDTLILEDVSNDHFDVMIKYIELKFKLLTTPLLTMDPALKLEDAVGITPSNACDILVISNKYGL